MFIGVDNIVSYGYTVICLSLILAGVCINALNPVVNTISDDFEDRITDGTISEQSAGHYENIVRIVKYIVPMSIIGLCAIYGLTRAQYSGE